ncbi:MAG: NADH-quinone oxidoreductase subunit J [Actinobacteria bacterium]|nr:NADH-quinone oxidoreductase subunit J [Actinomycetota bacterium]MCI0545443.1 NADH-quinone oxidoreductase subunit J [Actinomycetota bacterium]
MTLGDWISQPVNWVFSALGLAVVFSGFRVVTAKNVVHAALYLVGALAGTAGLFLLLSAEFVAWSLVLVYIGAVVVLFLFGIMITRAPTGLDPALDTNRKLVPGVLAAAVFALMTWAAFDAFGVEQITSAGVATDNALLGESLLGRFVIPFEVVSFVLLGALIGGITIARRDLTPVEEEERAAV